MDGCFVDIHSSVFSTDSLRQVLMTHAKKLERRCDLCFVDAHLTFMEQRVTFTLEGLEASRRDDLRIIDERFNVELLGNVPVLDGLLDIISQEVALMKAEALGLLHDYRKVEDFKKALVQQSVYIPKKINDPWQIIGLTAKPTVLNQCTVDAINRLKDRMYPISEKITLGIKEREGYLKKWEGIKNSLVDIYDHPDDDLMYKN
ncbi:hypothetical protein BKA67DRAFT_656500 [Truncatella angustata]|uniref:Uncharacterized protein n=1 Tax=Truncatella angustata TaxID=152316 RepID=A0A9P8UU02_9PEZI|nr:uncharacterized protein BKA67DRAFT_656500 [Truncatella angustata]KAH6658301.1 hypothetical protein BKA67DRAFT_656500 [Truncatella angustata]